MSKRKYIYIISMICWIIDVYPALTMRQVHFGLSVIIAKKI